MSKNSTGARRRQVKNRGEIAQVLAFPALTRSAPLAVAKEGSQIIIHRLVNGGYTAQLTDAYSDDLESAIRVLEDLWRQVSRDHRAATRSTMNNVIDLAAWRMA